jgi:hypothetical protein
MLKAVMAGVMSLDMLAQKGSTPRASFALSGAVEQRLADPAAASDLERQLAAAQAGLPSERQLRLPELRQLCLPKLSSAAAWMADNEASSVKLVDTWAFFAVMAAQLRVLPAVFGPPAGKMKEAALAGYEQALRLGPPHPRLAVHACNATCAASGSLFRLVHLLELALQMAEESNRPYWVCKVTYGLADAKVAAASKGLLTLSPHQLLQELQELVSKASASLQQAAVCAVLI